MAEVQKQADQAEKTSITKTAEAVKEGGVIAGQPNQEVHGKAFEQAHKSDKTLSEPDMIAMNDGETVAQYNARVAQIQANRFGFYDSSQEKTNDAGDAGAGKTKVHEHPAKQAVEPLPALSPSMQKPPFDSSVKVNAQITNVPEVSEAVQQEVLGKYAEAVLENAAAAVRQVENHLAQPNAINSDFQKIGQWVSEGPGHFAQSPEQLNKDVSAVTTGAMEEIDKPLSVDERAKKAGMLLPMFFFEGGKEPINPETIEQMGLEGMTEAELKALGIEKRVEVLEEGIAGKRGVLDERDIVNPIDRNATTESKIAQLQALSEENLPLIEDFTSKLDKQYGTQSSAPNLKNPVDIRLKAERPDLKDKKEWFRIEHIRDSLRFKTIVENLEQLPAIAEELKGSQFQILKIDTEKVLSPKGNGWRMVAFDLRAPNGQIVEYQVLVDEMQQAGGLNHTMYKRWRERELSTLSQEEIIQRKKDLKTGRDVADNAWESYLRRTGQTEKQIRNLLKQVEELF